MDIAIDSEQHNRNLMRRNVVKLISKALLVTCLTTFVQSAFALSPAPAPLPQKTTLTVAYLKVGHLAPLMLVEDELKKLNVDLKLAEFGRYADARTALLSGSVDVASVAPGDLPIALSQGNRSMVMLTGVATSKKYLVVRKDVKIDSWKDLAGKKIGVAPGSAVWFQWAATLAEKEIPYTTFTPINIQGGGTALVQALKRGDVDAYVGWEPFESQVVLDGSAYFAKGLEYSQSQAVGAELGAFAATKTALKDKREAVKRFLWAYLKAEEKLAADPKAYAQAYAKFSGVPLATSTEAAKLISLGNSLSADQVKRLATAFHKFGVIPKDVSGEVAEHYDDSIVRELKK
jgi:sulfonate transport system substrate-binding protein